MQQADIRKAADLIGEGQLVAMPTETVYGLAGDARNSRAVTSIFAVKDRPRFNPLICHVQDLEAAQRLGDFNDVALKVANAFWPGPLTLVVPLRENAGLSDLVTAGLETVALRVPNHPVAQALLKATGCPLAAPSANRSGRVSPTLAEHVRADLGGDVAMVLEGNGTQVGIESTIIDATGDAAHLLRLGAVTREALERVLGTVIGLPKSGDGKVRAPGQLTSHYAPSVPVRLNVITPKPGEALLAFGPEVPAHRGPVLNLSPAGSLDEAARNLFSYLRALDRDDIGAIAVMAIPNVGLGEAINDRLARAAAPRGIDG